MRHSRNHPFWGEAARIIAIPGKSCRVTALQDPKELGAPSMRERSQSLPPNQPLKDMPRQLHYQVSVGTFVWNVRGNKENEKTPRNSTRLQFPPRECTLEG